MQAKLLVLAAGILLISISMVSNGQVAGSESRSRKIRLFEIRTYTAEPGKLDAVHARFRDHTTKLFEKHGMTNIGYWTPADKPRSADTLVYVLAHDNREAAEKSWQAFRSDPEWLKVKAETEAAGPIVRKVESVFANPTDYSPME